MPEELDMTADSLTSWESNTRYDTFVAFSKRQYSLSKNAYYKMNEFLAKEISFIYSDENELLSQDEKTNDLTQTQGGGRIR